MVEEYHLTQDALDELRAELDEKLNVDRPKLAKRLKAAIELGDLSENAEYHSAKEAQGFLEGRIQHLQKIISNAVVINEDATSDGTVRLGTTVTVRQEGFDEPEVYQIVGKVEANPREGKISDESPLGEALIGSRQGDKVRYQAPAGELVFTIMKVE
jgi:transcription elongation factor GreA